MFLLDLRHRIQRRRTDRSDRRQETQRQSASSSRQQRAEEIRRLQDEVHRLQLEIADLSSLQEGSSVVGERDNAEAQMHMRQDELEQAQQALAKLQGRV
jgi:hypothetical protein